MTSPLSKVLFRRAIGESGVVVLLGDPLKLSQAEKRGETLAAGWRVPAEPSLKDLRAVSAIDIFSAEPDYLVPPYIRAPNLGIAIDGYIFPTKPAQVFATGQEHRVVAIPNGDVVEHIGESHAAKLWHVGRCRRPRVCGVHRSAKTKIALPELGRRISGASSAGISVDQLPPPTPAGIATYCFPFAKYEIGNP